MKKYTVTIEETISDDLEVIAENIEQARAIAIEKYNSGEFVLVPDNLIHKQMQISVDTEISTDWIEF